MPCYSNLILETGEVFRARRFGFMGECTGEMVFTTGVSGYLETLTDPSYYGQIVVQSFPLIGNYGVVRSEFESPCVHMAAYIVRQWCENPSNYQSEGDLDALLAQNGTIGLYGIDTRRLTKLIRERGTMNARVTDCPSLSAQELVALGNYHIEPPVAKVSCKEICAKGQGRRVVLWDFGAKENMRGELLRRGCKVIAVPHNTTADAIRALRPDGVFLSNGPGDPADNPAAIEQLSDLMQDGIPTMGICLGHQLMALARGGTTRKLKYGHRGANHPARDIQTNRVYITSQNHGYAVQEMPKRARQRFVHIHDGTCEGIDYEDLPAFSVQFHPEAVAGPLDTRFLFDRFVQLIDGCQHIETARS